LKCSLSTDFSIQL